MPTNVTRQHSEELHNSMVTISECPEQGVTKAHMQVTQWPQSQPSEWVAGPVSENPPCSEMARKCFSPRPSVRPDFSMHFNQNNTYDNLAAFYQARHTLEICKRLQQWHPSFSLFCFGKCMFERHISFMLIRKGLPVLNAEINMLSLLL